MNQLRKQSNVGYILGSSTSTDGHRRKRASTFACHVGVMIVTAAAVPTND
jgi:hypothetical protein